MCPQLKRRKLFDNLKKWNGSIIIGLFIPRCSNNYSIIFNANFIVIKGALKEDRFEDARTYTAGFIH